MGKRRPADRRRKSPGPQIGRLRLRLEQSGDRAIISRVNTSGMKVVGRLQRSPWQRFIRVQRTAMKLAKGKGQPKGVYRFSSYEECAAWEANLKRT